jgi:hypothetical protein
MNKADVDRWISEAGPLVRVPFDEWCTTFAGLVQSETLSKQKAKWYSAGHEDGMRHGIEVAAALCAELDNDENGGPNDAYRAGVRWARERILAKVRL